MIDTTGKCSVCGQTVGIDTIHTCSPQAPRPRVSEHTDAARLEALRDSMRPRVEGEAEMTLEWIQEMAACKDTTRDDRVMMVDPSRGLFLNQRNALARRVLALTAERDAVEVAVRKLCPLDNNEGYEDEDGDAVVYRCINEDGDAFIETESLAEAVEGMVASYDRVCEAFEAAQEEKHRLTAEVERLRKFAEKMITPCEWGPSAFIEEDESDISDWALSHGLLVERVHAQPCEVEGCECDGSPTLLYFAWSPEAAALALPTNAPEATDG